MMNLLKFCAPFLFLASFVSAKTIENYHYPYQNPYLATLTYEVIRSQNKIPVQLLKVPGLASRSAVPLLEGRNYTKVSIYNQKTLSPLVFMITGTGSQSNDPAVNTQAEILFQMGYHVIVIPSPLNWSFILSENTSALPGYTPDEARDLYAYLQKVMGLLKGSLKVSSYAIAGYSLGAAETAFMSEIDLKEKKFNFEMVLLVNPPLDLIYAVTTLDHLLYVAAKWTPQKIDYVQSLIYTYGEKITSRNPSDPTYYDGFEQTPFARTDYDMFLVGCAFRATLGDDIFTNQQIRDTGILKSKAVPGRQSEREAEARTISFTEYIQKLVLPTYVRENGLYATTESFFQSASVNSIREKLAQNPRVFIFHNIDDFLTKSEDLAEFEKLMGDRMTIFPGGGHLGNLWYPDNVQEFKSLFTALRN